jgi:hypothetical protein
MKQNYAHGIPRNTCSRTHADVEAFLPEKSLVAAAQNLSCVRRNRLPSEISESDELFLIQSTRVPRVIQFPLAVMSLLLALVVGPETHVHQGNGPNHETVVHIHFGIVGHSHTSNSSRSGLSRNDKHGRAVYLNAYSSVSTQATALPILSPGPKLLLAPSFDAHARVSEPEVRAHAPPLIESIRPRSPPLICSA